MRISSPFQKDKNENDAKTKNSRKDIEWGEKLKIPINIKLRRTIIQFSFFFSKVYIFFFYTYWWW